MKAVINKIYDIFFVTVNEHINFRFFELVKFICYLLDHFGP